MLRSLKRLLEPEFEVAAMTDNVISLLDALDQIEPDLLVLDTGSPEFGALDLAARLQLKHGQLRILLVGHDAENIAATNLPAHVAYVRRHNADESLLPAARGLLRPT